MEERQAQQLKNAVEMAKIDLENPNYYGDKPMSDIRPNGQNKHANLHLFTASAGSGKTWRLAFEFISLLLKDAFLTDGSEGDIDAEKFGRRAVDNFRHILAITFTNKATAEMKNRILANLAMLGNEKIADEKEKNERETYLSQLSNRLGVSADVVVARAKLVYANLLHDYSHFHIQTIDSFFQSVLRNLAQELGIGSYWEVELDADSVLKDAAHRLLNRVKDDPELLEWVTQYVKERLDDNKNWNIEGELVNFGANLFCETLVTNDKMEQFLAGEDGGTSALRKRIGVTKKMLYKAQKECEGAIKTKAQAFLDFCGQNGIEAEFFSRGTIYNYAAALAGGNWKEPGKMVDDFLNSKTADEMDKNAFSKKFQGRFDAVSLHGLLTDAVAAYNDNVGLSVVYSQVAKNINQIGLLADVKTEVAALQEGKNIFMLAYAQPLLHKFISSDDAPFVFERIGESLRYMMIDEFQDTSKVQFQNFLPLIENCCASNPGSLIVGDAKQAIYRFRNGDWRLIESLRSHAEGKDAPERGLQLSMPILSHDMQFNYRSSVNVVNFNNAVFRSPSSKADYPIRFKESIVSLLEDACGEANSSTDGALRNEYLSQIYSTSFQFPRKSSGGHVKVKFHQKTDADNQAEVPWTLAAMFAEVNRLHAAGVEYSDMTILTRFNKDIPAVATFLRSKGVPIVSDYAFLLRASLKVRLIVDALRYVDAYLSGASAASSFLLYKKELTCDYLRFTLHGDAENIDLTEDVPIVDEWCRKFVGLTDLDGEQNEAADVLPALPIYDMVEEIYRTIFPDSPTDEYVQTFFDHLRDYLVRHVASVRDVLQFWDERLSNVSIPADPKKTNGIRMLSIHRSKGLESHTVILANCSWKVTTDHQNSTFWCSGEGKFASDMKDYEIPVVPVGFSSNLENTDFAEEYFEEMAQMHAENVNLLYVALTRAKHNLVVIDEYRIPKSDKGTSKTVYLTASMGRLLHDVIDADLLQVDNCPFEWMDDCGNLLDCSADECYQIGDVLPSESLADSGAESDASDADFVDGCDTFSIKGRFRQSTAANAFIMHGELAVNKNVDFGLHMHNLLSYIDHVADVEHPEPEINKAVHLLVLEGVILSSEEKTYAERAVDYFKQLPVGVRSDWFAADKKVYNESNIILFDDWTSKKLEEKRPDRLVYDANTNTFAVVDYKTGKPSAKYVEQVQNYMRLVAVLSPNATVRGFLWYLNTNKVDEVFLPQN